jgi:hypothetical protein
MTIIVNGPTSTMVHVYDEEDSKSKLEMDRSVRDGGDKGKF